MRCLELLQLQPLRCAHLCAKGTVINAFTLFSSLVAFGQLIFPLTLHPMSLAQSTQAKASTKRVGDFFRLKEIVCDSCDSNEDGSKNVFCKRQDAALGRGKVSLKKVDVRWAAPEIPTETKNNEEEATTSSDAFDESILSNISLDNSPGELCAIVGMLSYPE